MTPDSARPRGAWKDGLNNGRKIMRVIECCPYCATQGMETPSEEGPDAMRVELDAGRTTPLVGALCRECRDAIGYLWEDVLVD